MFGFDSPLVDNPRVVTLQTISGTGALKMVALFLQKFRPAPIYVSNPSWPNHKPIFTSAGMDIREYRYFNMSTKGLDLDGLCEDLSKAAPGSSVLFQACGHNPASVDPTPE